LPADLQILTRTYDLILWTLNHTAKFPRSHRYSLGTRMEERLYSLLDDLVEAKYTHEKSEILRRAALRLEQIRYQFRLAKDLRVVPLNSGQDSTREARWLPGANSVVHGPRERRMTQGG
jgi:hypothetical protein